MKITIFGSGYVGLVTGACLADAGNQVVCVDIDAAKVALLNSGHVPIYEPGLEAIVSGNRAARRLSFTTDIAAGVEHGEALFIAVGTPPDETGSADLKYVLAVARSIGEHVTGFKVVADKSTVPVGTGDRVAEAITAELVKRGFAADPAERVRLGQPDFTVISNPEFLKEGAAVTDFNRPDRIIIGADGTPAGRRGLELMRQLYAPFTLNHDRTMVMDVRSAELTKYAANAMLATRISFMNELANLAEDLGADIELVRRGIGSDPRIGYSFLYAGTGYGGSCFPKDVSALRHSAAEQGRELRILAAVEEANTAQKDVLGGKIRTRFGEDLTGLTFAVWGLSFKPNTDDMRDAPSRVLIADLLRRGAAIRAYDPVAMEEAKRVLAFDLDGGMGRIDFVETAMAAVTGADALVIVTEWKVFRNPDFAALARGLGRKAIFDGRNLYEPSIVEDAGLAYFPIGRRQVS
ncbi:UDP-glucose/GDP-mannose dehydrogenase family protein [Devosia sp. Root105]|uniref:UDP-glucose dehydrogenase family protein n=1 Tax=Devosia sp. Root105 TaxID=1736423 RepID=UPI0006FD72AF|nr:UDP-glucose/GDP-mannose dehydrogenase family protein [Devosia sp. Root105]KQU99461.1 UDP-glucose 6-dehydrogenase [Devosia sp. Root105]